MAWISTLSSGVEGIKKKKRYDDLAMLSISLEGPSRGSGESSFLLPQMTGGTRLTELQPQKYDSAQIRLAFIKETLPELVSYSLFER